MCQDAAGLPHLKPQLTYPASGKVQLTVGEESDAFIACMGRYGVLGLTIPPSLLQWADQVIE